MGNWSELSADLLILVEERLLLYVDKVRFRSVCVSWKSSPPKITMPNHQVKQFPWLLHPISQNNTTTAEAEAEAFHYGLFDPLENKVYNLYLPEAQGMFFKGSSHGWVVTIADPVTGSGPDMYLLNPFTRAQIKLPPRSKFPDVMDYHPNNVGTEFEYTIRDENGDHNTNANHANLHLLQKVVLSSSPFQEDCVIVAIYGVFNELAYCRCNDKEWKFLSGESVFTDVIFHKGKLHALNMEGELLVFENISRNPKRTQVVVPPTKRFHGCYLVECCDGGLIMVVWCRDDKNIDGFQLYKLDPNTSSWFQVYDIGDDILFLGPNSTLAISSHDLPGYKGNCIYFGETTKTSKPVIKNGTKIRAFNLVDRSTKALPDFNYSRKVVWPPPIWISPITF